MNNPSKTILVNAVNMTGAGARAIGLSLIPELVRSQPQRRFCLLVPDDAAFRSLPYPGNAEVRFKLRRRGLINELIRIWELFWLIPRTAEKVQAGVCLTLGDINPAGLPCPGVLFVQQALLAYKREELTGSQTWSLGKQLVMHKVFSLTVNSASAVIVQTAVMSRRLQAKYKIPPQKFQVIRQPVPKALQDASLTAIPNPVMAGHKENIKLLFLSKGYPHKNHAILPAVAHELRRLGLAGQVRIYTTLDPAGEADLASQTVQDHDDVITNLGTLSAPEVAGAFKAASALLLPTLIESYGLIYLEAMSFGLPILTSDRDFAREMCRDQALYFDPNSAVSIVAAIQKLLAEPKDRTIQKKRTAGDGRFPADWKQVAYEFMQVMEQAMAEEEHASSGE